jgi:RNA polymerase-binding transcription factor DksA
MKLDVNGEYRTALMRVKDRLADKASPLHSRVTMAQVDAALDRLEHNTFGVCTGCFMVIPKAELLMRPYTELCPDCGRRRVA